MNELEQDILELRQHYRNTFDSLSGRLVFHDLLLRSSFFDRIESDDKESMGARNMMLDVVKILGAYGENPKRVSEAITTALLQQPIKECREREDDYTRD